MFVQVFVAMKNLEAVSQVLDIISFVFLTPQLLGEERVVQFRAWMTPRLPRFRAVLGSNSEPSTFDYFGVVCVIISAPAVALGAWIIIVHAGDLPVFLRYPLYLLFAFVASIFVVGALVYLTTLFFLLAEKLAEKKFVLALGVMAFFAARVVSLYLTLKEPGAP